jgi:hypothetical protein
MRTSPRIGTGSRASWLQARKPTLSPRRAAPERGSRTHAAADRRSAPSPRATFGAGDCASPRFRPVVPPRTRRGAVRHRRRAPRFSPRDLRPHACDRAPAPETMLDHGRARSGGKVGAALAAPASNDRATRSIAHPEPEAVLLLAFPVVRLVRPFHPWPPRTPGPRWGRGAGRAACRGARAQVDSRVYGQIPKTGNRGRERTHARIRTLG